MATTRKKKTIISNVTREQAEKAMADYSKAQARAKKINADIELECTRIREKYAADAEQLTAEMQKAFDTLEAYAKENPQLFDRRRSSDLLTGSIGYRTGMPQFKTERGFTQTAVIALIKDEFPSRVADFVKTTEAINKEAIIAESRKGEDDEDRLDMAEFRRTCHAYVEQEETFFVQAKEEDAIG